MINFVQRETVFWRMKAFSSYISLWDVVALKAALLPTEIWEIPEGPKISPNMREGNENTTQGKTSITSINVFSSK